MPHLLESFAGRAKWLVSPKLERWSIDLLLLGREEQLRIILGQFHSLILCHILQSYLESLRRDVPLLFLITEAVGSDASLEGLLRVIDAYAEQAMVSLIKVGFLQVMIDFGSPIVYSQFWTRCRDRLAKSFMRLALCCISFMAPSDMTGAVPGSVVEPLASIEAKD